MVVSHIQRHIPVGLLIYWYMYTYVNMCGLITFTVTGIKYTKTQAVVSYIAVCFFKLQ